MNTFNCKDKVEFVLHDLRVEAKTINEKEWWEILEGVLAQVRPHLKSLLGYIMIGDVLETTDPVEIVTRLNTGITVCDRGISRTTRYFTLFNDVLRDNVDEGAVNHLLLSYDGDLLMWKEIYTTPRARLERMLTCSHFSILTERGFVEWSQELTKKTGDRVVLGYLAFMELTSLLGRSVREKQKRLNVLAEASARLQTQFDRVILK